MYFVIPGTPVAKGRPRMGRYGTYTPKKTVEYENLVRMCWAEQSGESFEKGTPLRAEIAAYFPIPKSVSNKKRYSMEGMFHTHKCDCDNLAKSILDALQKKNDGSPFAFYDDSCVCELVVTKRYSGEPRAEVKIENAKN